MSRNKQSQGSSLGRALIKHRFKGEHRQHFSARHTTDLDDGMDWNKLNLRSVTEENTLDEFLSTAELANKQFTAEKLDVKLVSAVTTGLPSKEEEKRQKDIQDSLREQLKIPRRPAWDAKTTAEELDLKERDSFLLWRKSLAVLSETDKIVMTPYERNLDVWRQLWRVIERSNVIVQIVDARNPLLFRCTDLETYVKEVKETKQCILLLNKSDFLTYQQRVAWAKYFDQLGVIAVFWSAALELLKDKGETADEESARPDEPVEDEPVEDEPVEDEPVEDIACHDNSKNSPRILNTDELVEMLRTFSVTSDSDLRSFGLVGYPNVGKSSTINALLNWKERNANQEEKIKHLQAPVSATPGKTKHFQTFFLTSNLLLCDCPGLVFPTFVSTKAEMIINGILPIDQMTDCVPPTSVVCHLIPRDVLESNYGIMLPVPSDEVDPDRSPTAHELLGAYARIRGFMTHKGIPDFQRASRLILKDFVNGKLCYCHAPPGVSEEEYGSKPCVKEDPNTQKNNERSIPSSAVLNFDPCLEEVMADFGNRGVFRRGGLEKPPTEPATRPVSKRHGNSNKREKTRRTWRHLDA